MREETSPRRDQRCFMAWEMMMHRRAWWMAKSACALGDPVKWPGVKSTTSHSSRFLSPLFVSNQTEPRVMRPKHSDKRDGNQ